MSKRKSNRHTFGLILLSAIIILIAGAAIYYLASCAPVDVAKTDAQLTATQAQLKQSQDKAAADAAAAQQAIAAAQAAGNAAALATAQAALEKANKTAELAEEWSKKLAEAQAQLHAATATDGSITAGSGVAGAATAAGAVLPPPWNLILTIGAPLLVGLVQELRVRGKVNDAVSLINGIEAAKAYDPNLRMALERAKPLLTAEYTDAAIDLVDTHKLAKPS